MRVFKIAKSDCKLRNVCLSIGMEKLALTGGVVTKFDTWVFFENVFRKFKFHLHFDKGNVLKKMFLGRQQRELQSLEE
jgi:hypothetical protein